MSANSAYLPTVCEHHYANTQTGRNLPDISSSHIQGADHEHDVRQSDFMYIDRDIYLHSVLFTYYSSTKYLCLYVHMFQSVIFKVMLMAFFN
jgi:hypothetical protein